MSNYVSRTEPWYTEEWFDEDIEDVLLDLHVRIDELTMNAARKALKGIYDNKSERFELMRDVLSTRFGVKEW